MYHLYYSRKIPVIYGEPVKPFHPETCLRLYSSSTISITTKTVIGHTYIKSITME